MQTPLSLVEAVRKALLNIQQGKDPDLISSKEKSNCNPFLTFKVNHLRCTEASSL